MKYYSGIVLSVGTVILLSVYGCKNENPDVKSGIKYETSGPQSGSLVIVGGNMKDTPIINSFISLAGGVDAPMIVIPTAGGEKVIDNASAARVLTSAGARNVTVLHTYDSAVANTEEFVKLLKTARGVWFNGGRQIQC